MPDVTSSPPVARRPGSGLELIDLHAADVEHWLPQLHELYAAVYTAPGSVKPAEVLAAFPGRLRDHAHRGGFRCSVAMSGTELVGACYAFSVGDALPDEPFYAALTAALGPDGISRHLLDACELPDVLVRPSAQRRGLGTRLLDHRLRDERRAWLLTAPDGPGIPLYRRLGWVECATYVAPDGRPRVVFSWSAGDVSQDATAGN
ncbi:MAG: GNAT family N-acetyltransferase [Dermatophilaceae bacterium]